MNTIQYSPWKILNGWHKKKSSVLAHFDFFAFPRPAIDHSIFGEIGKVQIWLHSLNFNLA